MEEEEEVLNDELVEEEDQKEEVADNSEEDVEASETEESEEEESEEESETEEEEVEDVQQFASRLFPTRKFESQDQARDAVVEYARDLEEYVERGKQANAVLTARVQEDPDFAQFMTDTIEEGLPFRVAIAKNFTPDELFPEEGDPDYEKLQEIRTEQKKERERKQALQVELTNNRSESEKVINAFTEKFELDEKGAQDFFGKVDNVISELAQYRVTPETLESLFKAFNYEEDVKAAKDQAAVTERNKKIKLQKAKPTKADSLPDIKSSGTEIETAPPKPQSRWVQAVRERNY